MRGQLLPVARADRLVVEELQEEVLVYDLVNNKAHCLNRTSAAVWRLCDGERTPAEIAEALESEAGAKIDERMVALALEQLGSRRLLSERHEVSAGPARMSRRRVMRQLGIAAVVALPVITTIVAPTAAHAQSGCLPDGSACSVDSQCCSGTCAFTGSSSTCQP